METGSEIKLTLYGDPITKKNSQSIITVGGRQRIIPSSQYRAYEEACLWQIRWRRQPIEKPVNVACVYYLKTDRQCDLVNLLEGTLDILVDARVLHDDNRRIVARHDGCAVYVDRKNPRVEIAITEV